MGSNNSLIKLPTIKESEMTKIDTLSEERKGEIAWALILLRVQEDKVSQLFVGKLNSRLKNLLKYVQDDDKLLYEDSLREFSSDIADALFGLIKPGSLGDVEYSLGSVFRGQISYVVYVAIAFEEGFRFGKNTKREVNKKAKDINMDPLELQQFFTSVGKDSLNLVFK